MEGNEIQGLIKGDSGLVTPLLLNPLTCYFYWFPKCLKLKMNFIYQLIKIKKLLKQKLLNNSLLYLRECPNHKIVINSIDNLFLNQIWKLTIIWMCTISKWHSLTYKILRYFLKCWRLENCIHIGLGVKQREKLKKTIFLYLSI